MAGKKRLKNGASSQAIRRVTVRMADSDEMARSIDRSRWEVACESSPGSWHMVAITEGGIVCDYPYHVKRKGASCRHAAAVKIILLRETATIRVGEPPASHGDGVPPYAPGGAESACAGALWYVVSLCALWRSYGPWSRAW